MSSSTTAAAAADSKDGTRPKMSTIHHKAKHTAADVAAKEAGAVSNEEWAKARRALMAKEKELARHNDAVLAERRALPWTKLTTDYMFKRTDGSDVKFSELFTNGTTELVVQHLMYDPANKNACSSCSAWLDGFTGPYAHISQKTNLVAIAKATHQQLATLQASKGWPFPVLSSHDNTFNADFAVELTADEKKAGKNTRYNFGDGSPYLVSQMPGISCFTKSPQTGVVYRTYGAFARGLDECNGANHLFDMLAWGREGFQEKDLKHKEAYTNLKPAAVAAVAASTAAGAAIAAAAKK